MIVEASSRINKPLYKIELFLLKIIPMLLAGIYLVNTILSYFFIDLPILSTIGGTSLLPLIFLYVSSYAFHFCEYHRIFLHYIAVNDLLCWLDYSYGIPLSNWDYLVMHIILAGICAFLILYLRFRNENFHKEIIT